MVILHEIEIDAQIREFCTMPGFGKETTIITKALRDNTLHFWYRGRFYNHMIRNAAGASAMAVTKAA